MILVNAGNGNQKMIARFTVGLMILVAEMNLAEPAL
jgi:hypothetical protein